MKWKIVFLWQSYASALLSLSYFSGLLLTSKNPTRCVLERCCLFEHTLTLSFRITSLMIESCQNEGLVFYPVIILILILRSTTELSEQRVVKSRLRRIKNVLYELQFCLVGDIHKETCEVAVQNMTLVLLFTKQCLDVISNQLFVYIISCLFTRLAVYVLTKSAL